MSGKFQNKVTQVASGRAETEIQYPLLLISMIFLGLNTGFTSFQKELLPAVDTSSSSPGSSLLDQATVFS